MGAPTAASPDSMVVHGHLSHGYREEPRLEPRLSHDLLSHVHDTLEDSVKRGHPFDFAAARCGREEECTSFKVPPTGGKGQRPSSALCGFRAFFTALEGPRAKDYRPNRDYLIN